MAKWFGFKDFLDEVIPHDKILEDAKTCGKGAPIASQIVAYYDKKAKEKKRAELKEQMKMEMEVREELEQEEERKRRVQELSRSMGR